MTQATSRRLTITTIRIVGRHPDDYAEELQRFLEKLAKQVHGGIPAGFNEETPTRVEADVSADPGTETAGWAAADHQHDVAVESAGGLGNANAEGSSNALARADHVHKRDVRVFADGVELSTRNALNFEGLSVVDDPAGDLVTIGVITSISLAEAASGGHLDDATLRQMVDSYPLRKLNRDNFGGR